MTLGKTILAEYYIVSSRSASSAGSSLTPLGAHYNPPASSIVGVGGPQTPASFQLPRSPDYYTANVYTPYPRGD
jgi:hypothetical protein